MIQKSSKILGTILIVIGALGFLNDPVIGLFEVDILHNIVHLMTGILIVAFSNTPTHSKILLKTFGVIYGVAAILGFIIPGDVFLGIVEINNADDILHVVFSSIFLWIGYRQK